MVLVTVCNAFPMPRIGLGLQRSRKYLDGLMESLCLNNDTLREMISQKVSPCIEE